MRDEALAVPMTAFQCIGCGRIESPQECIGVCTSRKVAFVYEEDFRELQQELEQTNRRLEEQSSLLRRLALATPRTGQWEDSYRRLQADARHLLR